MSGGSDAGVTAYVDQYLSAVNYLRRAWPFNRELNASETITRIVLDVLARPVADAETWEGKENGHGYMLIPDTNTCMEFDPELTRSDELRAFIRASVGNRGPGTCNICGRVTRGEGGWLPLAWPPTLIVLGVCEFDSILITADYTPEWL